MERAIKQIEEDLGLFLQGQTTAVLRKELGDNVDLRAARLIIFSLQWASVGYQSVLRFAGAKLGQAIGMHFETREISFIINDIKKIFERLKWGKVAIEINQKDKKINLRISDSLTSAGVPNINQNLCFFEEGFIEGCLDGAMKKQGTLTLVGLKESVSRVDVAETGCVGQGATCCSFAVTLRS